MAINISEVMVDQDTKKATASGGSSEPSGTHSWVIRKHPNLDTVDQGAITVQNGQWSVTSGTLSDGSFEFRITTCTPQLGEEFVVGGL